MRKKIRDMTETDLNTACEAMRQEILALLPSITGDVPIRQYHAAKRQIGAILFRSKELCVDVDYWAFVADCTLHPHIAKESLDTALHRLRGHVLFHREVEG